MTKAMQSWLVLAMAGAIVVGLTLWRMGMLPPGDRPAPWLETPSSSAPESLPSTEPAAPAIAHPLADSPAPPLLAREVGQALANLLGKEAVDGFVQIDEFPRRFAATVDNLARAHAPALLWPVAPTTDRFVVDPSDDGPVIGAANGQRYTAFVQLAESVNTVRAVDLYARLYPLLQSAYGELGFPGRYFNDRLISVIDVLLATPRTEGPVKVQLTEVKGPVPSLRPWVRYEFVDPELEQLTAGQKMLVRMGPENERRLKAKLAEIRAELLRRSPAR